MFRLPIVKFFNRIFNRVTITVVLVALQVLWLLWAFWSFTAGRVWLNGALKALSILIVLYLVRKDENSAYKIGWIVLIGLLPLLGGALYLAFGNKAPAKYLRERMQKVEQAHQTELAQPEGQTDALDISSRNLSRYVAKFGPYPAWRDTAAHYFSCGEEMYPQLLADLDKAEKFIFLEFFILRSGKMWDGVEQILRRKAAQGVDVRMIYDDVGCATGLPAQYWKTLQVEGIQAVPFNPFVPLLNLVMNSRDHRKIVVVDGKTAFTGGFNLADEYINQKERFGYWCDTGVRLQGPAAWSFATIFLELWASQRPDDPGLDAYREEQPFPAEEPTIGLVQPYSDSPVDDENVSKNVYLDLITQAQETLWITTPYLILDNATMTALRLAAKRGVDVRIYTPGIPDKKMVYQLTCSYFEPLIRSGVKIYTFTPGFLHAKTWLVDGRIAVVGSINLDYRSLYLHFECAALLYGCAALADVGEFMMQLEKQSHLVELKECRTSAPGLMVSALLRLLAPLC